MVVSIADEQKIAELDRRRGPLTKLVAKVRAEQGLGESRAKPGGFVWSNTIFNLLAKNPERVLSALAHPNTPLALLGEAIQGVNGVARVQAICETANKLSPGACRMEGQTLRWSRSIRIGGASASELDFFLAHDLLDTEERL